MTYADGFRYDGDWQAGVRQGQAVASWSDGTTYTGTYVNGLREGKGDLVQPDGFKYSGDWNAGQMEGQGIATYPEGDVYEGSFVAGKLAAFKVPVEIQIQRDPLPRNANGKIMKNELKKVLSV